MPSPDDTIHRARPGMMDHGKMMCDSAMMAHHKMMMGDSAMMGHGPMISDSAMMAHHKRMMGDSAMMGHGPMMSDSAMMAHHEMMCDHPMPHDSASHPPMMPAGRHRPMGH